MTPGLVSQLQQDAVDKDVSVSTLLRKVKIAAVKLNLSDALDWVDAELTGYSKDVPDYRKIHGRLKWWNPYRGYLPVGFPNQKTADLFELRPVFEAITSLEATLLSGDGTYTMNMPPAVTAALSKSFEIPVTEAILEVPKGALVGIIEHVRGLALDWALALERAGIMGENLGFTLGEKSMAKSAHISIGSFHGSLNAGDTVGEGSSINQAGRDLRFQHHQNVFGTLKAAVASEVEDETERAALTARVEQLEAAIDAPSRLEAYRSLLADSANYMTLMAPFLPALTSLLS